MRMLPRWGNTSRSTTLLTALHRAVHCLRLAELREGGTAPDKVIHKAEALGAKPTRYQPCPGRPQPGKRRRQWR